MCGICGFLQQAARHHADMESVIVGMSETVRHRGPDEQGIFIDQKNGLALGHQRLSIIDIASGHQPMANEDDTVHIVFNGEIYNFREIRAILVAKGHIFRTYSDTETIIHAYEEWGKQCLERLRGMFAFAIWDSREKRLFCARDRVGIKPFYYYWDNHDFIFGSEIKAVLAHPRIFPMVDNRALENYLRLFYIPAPQTIYRKIFKLPPGHSLLLENSSLSIEPYWDLSHVVKHQNISLNIASQQVRQILQEAIDIRLISEVPLGAFLSGGVDSSIVVALMSQIVGEGVLTHTVGFVEKEFDESAYAAEIAAAFNCDHSEIILEPDVRGILPRLVWHMDEPFGDSSMIPTYYICQAARKRVTVCLSGDGGDELFAGYNWYADLQRLQRLDEQIPPKLRNGIGWIGKMLPVSVRGVTLLRNLSADWPERHINLLCGFADRQIRKLLGKESEAPLSRHPLLELYDKKTLGQDPVSDAQYVDFSSYMVDDILMKVDKMSMAHSLEVRVPLLDHQLVEQAFSIPTHLKISGNARKIVLTECVQDLITKQFFARKKQGFSIPLKQWLRHELNDYVYEYLLSSSSRSADFFDIKEIVKIWEMMNQGKLRIDLSPHIWALLNFELWARTFLAPAKGKTPIT